MKLIGLVPVRNAEGIIEQSLQAMALLCDEVIVLDDHSEDRTVDIVRANARSFKVVEILTKGKWERDEPGDRNRLLAAGRGRKGTHYAIVDADEMFTAGWVKDGRLRKLTASLKPGMKLSVRWIHPWRGLDYVRWDDSGPGLQFIDAVFCDDGRSLYESEFIHTRRSPNSLADKETVIPDMDEGLLHLQYVNWRNVLIKQAWYRFLERIRLPEKPIAEINARYASSCDETGLGLRPTPPGWFYSGDLPSRTAFARPDNWRQTQISDWIKKYGLKYFEELDVWDPEIWPEPDCEIAELLQKRGPARRNSHVARFGDKGNLTATISKRLLNLTKQCEHERTLRKQEADAKKRAQTLLREAEVQRDHEHAAREQEAAAKLKAQSLLKATEAQRNHEHAAREQEAAARLKTQKLLTAAEAQIAQEQKAREQEAAAKLKVQSLLTAAEAQIDAERKARELEIAAKGKALEWAQAAEAAKQHWQQMCKEAEKQRDGLTQNVAELKIKIAALSTRMHELQERSAQEFNTIDRQTALLQACSAEQAQSANQLAGLAAQLSHANFARDLAAEQARQNRLQYTIWGRWLGLRNMVARWLRQLYCVLRRKSFLPGPADPGPGVTQINTHDIIGGAERTSYDLHIQFRQRGLNPTLIVGGKYGNDADVFKIPFRSIDWKPASIWRDRWGLTEILYPTPLLGCFEWPNLRHARIVHIHNMHGHFWNSITLLPLGMQHPLVLTLHDEYTVSGDCCYTYDCERWTRSCGKCPQMGLERSARYALGERDLTRLNIQIKRAIFRSPRAYPLVIVTPTRWLADRARRSPNLRHLPIITINNGIDTAYWSPLPQAQARKALGLPEGKTIGLLVASHLSDRRKGFDVALQAIRQLPANNNLLFVIVGNITEETKASLAGLPVIATGYVSEKIKMLNLYSAADFTFAMSRVDNLPYMCVESLTCGRPVFGSNVGGIPEIINEPDLGWLAEQPFNMEAIVRTLLEIDREPTETRLRRFATCRRSGAARFSLDLMTRRYLRLYQELQDSCRESRAIALSALADDEFSAQ